MMPIWERAVLTFMVAVMGWAIWVGLMASDCPRQPCRTEATALDKARGKA
jgi:hypothetical protein